MIFRPAPSRGVPIGLGLLAVAVLACLLLALALGAIGAGPRAAILLAALLVAVPLTLRLAYWVWGLASLRYVLGRDGLVIRWAATRQVIPMSAITHVLAGRPYDHPLAGMRWPGHEVGRTTLRDDDGAVRDALVYASAPPESQLVVLTPALAYAISPADPQSFVDDFRMRHRLGPTQAWEQHTARAPIASLSLLADRPALALLGLAAALNVLAFLWLTWHYPELPAQVALRLRFDPAAGRPVPGPLSPTASAWNLPLIGLATIALNGVLAAAGHARARLAALLLGAGAAAVQVVIGAILANLA